jgi:hypothetical protein
MGDGPAPDQESTDSNSLDSPAPSGDTADKPPSSESTKSSHPSGAPESAMNPSTNRMIGSKQISCNRRNDQLNVLYIMESGIELLPPVRFHHERG